MKILKAPLILLLSFLTASLCGQNKLEKINNSSSKSEAETDTLLLENSHTQSNYIQQHTQYNTYLLLGEEEINSGNYQEAILYFDSARSLFPDFHKPYWLLASYSIFEENDSIPYSYFIKMINTGCAYSTAINFDEQWSYTKSSYHQDLLQMEDSLYNLAMQRFDSNFVEAIEKVIKMKRESCYRPGALDTTVLHEFIRICKQYNAFPSCKNVGSDLYRKAYSLLIANSLYGYDPNATIWKDIYTFMRTEFLKGGIEASKLLLLEDIDCYHRNLPQKYGLLLPYNFSDAIYPSLSTINENRRNNGLAPILPSAPVISNPSENKKR